MAWQSRLTREEEQAAEAAFRGLPPQPEWPEHAQRLYASIVALIGSRDVFVSAESHDMRQAV